MKKLFACFLCIVLFSAVLTGCGAKKEGEARSDSSAGQAGESSAVSEGMKSGALPEEDSEGSQKRGNQGELHHVEIEVKDYGTIALELDAGAAPATVANFVELAKDGFYDGLTFHRIISGFMIQGGDPLGNGTGGADKQIKGEFAQNGVENPISHERGVISMARSKDPDSASSQFFIVHEDSPFLDGSYAAFGHVTEGIEIVDQICADTPVQDDKGTVAQEDQPTITSVKVVD